MKQKEEFEVAVAAFQGLLSRNGVYLDYLSAWHRSHRCNYGDTIRQCWIKWIDKRSPYDWLSSAFLWDAYNIPHQVWRDINRKWTEWISQNLNN